MFKLRWLIPFLALISSSFGDCDGFNWYHNINLDDCDPSDRAVLKKFIANSGDSLEIDMDVNYNGEVEILELGWQLWENGRLVHWICQEVPSPYYFYEYDCGLSGNIPAEIGNLDALTKLRLHSNSLSGEIPASICNLNIIESGNYWFNLANNNLCPPYPNCLEEMMGTQIITNCK